MLGRALIPLFFGAFWAAACGGDGDDDDDDAPNFGTCDLRSLSQSCIEMTGTPINLHNQEDGCRDAGGSWSSQPCSAEESIGCCTYKMGSQFRECFYPTTRDRDVEAYCAMRPEGAWTPAVP